MTFDDLDALMRLYEMAHDQMLLPGLYVVARLDGRGFTRLTKEELPLERPFDAGFRDMMLATAEHLMACGFRVVYAHTQSDEISLLLHPLEDAFGRKVRKYLSILAGEASARFSLLVGRPAAFDCRLSQLPNRELVVDYFRWRAEDAHRNALNAHCYWKLRDAARAPAEANALLAPLSIARKNELLFQHGVNFNDLPAWQRRGVGVRWETVEQRASDPRSGNEAGTARRHPRVDLELPVRDAYESYILNLLDSIAAEL